MKIENFTTDTISAETSGISMSKQTSNDKIYPLTKQQQGLWIEWKLHPENTSYNTCVKVKLTGPMDKNRLGQALHDIVKYFDSLKVYFIEKKGVPYQCMKQEAVYFLDYEDISTDNLQETEEQKQQGLDYLSKKLNTPVDLKEFPIVRAALIKTAINTHYLIGMVPHMISDGRSAVLFLESLSIAYNEGYQGLETAYDPTKKNWDDYFNDSRTQLDEEKHALSKTHWQNRLLDANHYFDYSYGRKNQQVDDKQGHRVYFDISQELAKALKENTSKNKTTLFNVIVCAFSIFIHRYFALNDILIGYPVNIRPPGFKHLFGFFVNIIPVRIDLSGDPTYHELLGRVSASRKEDKRHQKFPALDIVSTIRETVTDFDGTMFNLSMAQTVSRIFNLHLEGITTQPLESEYNDVNDDLSLSYEILENGIGLWFEYRTSMFDRKFIEQAMNHIRLILEQMTTNPDLKLSQFKLNSAEEEAQLLTLGQAKNIASETSSIKSIQQLFEQQVTSTSQATALLFNADGNTLQATSSSQLNSSLLSEQKLSYQQLNERANQLAHHLIEKGIKPHSKIAVCLNRGPELITSLLAILKTGSCYIPLAPDYPRFRIEFILEDTNADLLIYNNETQSLCDDLKSSKSINSIYFNLNEEASQTHMYSDENPELNITEDALAYIIYTSGSTGKPKGVPILHKNVTPRLLFLHNELPLNTTDIMLQSTDFTFDVSVAEIFWPLISGASLALIEQDKNKDPGYLIDLIKQHQITTSCMVPSLLNALLSIAKNDDLNSLTRVLAAGEALAPSLRDNFYHMSQAELYNFYGPTEASIYSTFSYCEPHIQSSCIPIGKPLSDTQSYILDDNLQLQPKGVAGELYLGGVGIADGYLNRPELTEVAFIKNPFSNNPSDTLYKTGDLARYQEDGNIDFLGRLDSQVKIRGFRIELAEIETVLSGFESIKDVVIVTHGKGEEAKRLVAYYVSEKDLVTEDIKNFLSENIPSYMIPALFVKMDEIPRTNSGKLNRNKLPKPEQSIKRFTKFTPASTKIEKKLANIWSEILKIPTGKISIHDSFFDLGGDSLMAIQFVCAAEEKGLIFETSTLFDQRTISDLAAVSSKLTKVNVEQTHIEGEFPLSARQIKFFSDDFVNPNHWNRLFLFNVDKNISVKALQKSIDNLLMHHDALRVRFLQHDDESWIQQSSNCLPDKKVLFNYNLTQSAPENQSNEIIEYINQSNKNIRLNEAPLIQALYFKTSKNEGKLAIVAHHLLLDMVSSRIIFEDLMKGYEYARRGLKIKLAQKTSSLKQWTEYLHQYAHNADFTTDLNYWGQLATHPSPTIPTDFPLDNHSNIEASAKTITFETSHDCTKKLLKTIPANLGLKIQNILLASFLKMTQQWTNENEATVSICGHGRDSGQTDINLSRTVGWLNTVFPVRLVANSSTSNDDLAFVKDITEQLAQVPTRNMNYNILRYISKHPEITAHQNPQLFFNYVGQIDAIMPDKIPFKPTMDLQGITEIDDANHLGYLLYFEAGVIEEKLTIRLTYSQKLFTDKTVQMLSDNLMKTIETISNNLT